KGAKGGLPPFTVLPGPIRSTGIDIPHGQSSGWLGPACDPFQLGADPAASDFDPGSALDRARRFLDNTAKRDPTCATALDGAIELFSTRPARNAFDLEKECAEVRDA